MSRRASSGSDGGRSREASTAELIDLGKLVRRHGVRGELRMLPHNPASPAVLAVDEVALFGERAPLTRWIRITAKRPHKSFILLRFEGVDTAEAADELVGLHVGLHRDQLPELADGEVYHCDLIGRPVSTDTGVALGVVEEILPTGSNDVLIVREGKREYLIPWIDEVVVSGDEFGAEGDIVIRPLPGLLDP